MDSSAIVSKLDASGDVVRLTPQIVGRFYGDGNRLGQRAADAPRPPYYKPERWIGSCTEASNPPEIPSGGLSTCPDLDDVKLKDLVAHEEIGPRLLGEDRFNHHNGRLLVLIKLLDAGLPIPFHVHAPDDFVKANPKVYLNEKFGKDEAYHFLDVPKGDCAYTHAGLYDGVTAKDVIAAMRRGTDHVLELSPGAFQNYGEGFMVKAGMLHRPGTALTLEIQQPSDVYTFFQTDFGGEPLADEVLHPGFDSIEAAAEAVVDWEANTRADVLEAIRLKPTRVMPSYDGGKVEWVFPPERSKKFSGMRITVETKLKFEAKTPCVLYVWRGEGTLNDIAIDGGGGPVGKADEFFIGKKAINAGLQFENTGDVPLVAFALFPAML